MHLGLRSVQHQEYLVEIGLGVRIDLFASQDGARLRATAGVPNQRCEIPNDQDDDMTVVLERPQRVKDDQVPNVKIGGGGIKSELDPNLVAAIQSRAEVIRNVDLHRPLAQALEELRAHEEMGLADQARREVDLWVAGQDRSEDADDRLADASYERHRNLGALYSVPDL